jgi:hypothetical protein
VSFAIAAVGVGAAASIAGGAMAASATKDAADTQAQSAREATALQERMYNQQRADNEPWRLAGTRAIAGMENADFQRDFTAADFQQDPGYAFRMSEGQRALERSAAARGGLQSGGTLKALAQYGQNFASNEYQNAYNRFNADRDRRFGRLGTIAGMGQASANQVGAAGQNFANQAGANMMGAANAQGAAQIAGANAWGDAMSGVSGAVSSGAGIMQQNNWMDRILKAQGK